jgi:hypothetical protein
MEIKTKYAIGDVVEYKTHAINHVDRIVSITVSESGGIKYEYQDHDFADGGREEDIIRKYVSED